LEPQVVFTLPLLEGLDGTEKMSKSLGNYVAVEDPPKEMFGKLMSVSDELMWRYYTLLTDLAPAEIESLKTKTHPKEAKVRLARTLITYYHGGAAAEEAAAEFERVFAQKETPEEVEERMVDASQKPLLYKFIAEAGLAKSNSEARKLIEQGGVELGGKKVPDANAVLDAAAFGPDGTVMLKVGKRKFLRLRRKL
jgi:tyrosyl-tRNA synthetase